MSRSRPNCRSSNNRLEEIGDTVSAERPYWRQVFDAPFISMVVAIVLYAIAAALGISIGALLPGANSLAKGVVVVALVIGTYKLVIVRLGERPRDDLPAAGTAGNLAKGVLTGFLILTAVVGIAFALGVYKVVGRGDASGMPVTLVTVAIVPAFSEEILFRGILFRWIEELAGSWAALVVTSALFGLAHILNPGATWFSSFAIAVEAGLLLGAVYMLTRSLWMPIGLHAAWNFTEGPVFGVPVSGGPTGGLVRARIGGPPLLTGGAFGLEASIIAVIVATVAGLWFLRVAIKQGRLVSPSWTRRLA